MENVAAMLLGSALAAVVALVIAMLWYSPYLFGPTFMRLAKMPQQTKNMTVAIVGQYIAYLVVALVMCHFLMLLGHNYENALQVGLLAWVGFAATTQLGAVLWGSQSVQLYLLHVACDLAVYLAIPFTIVFFTKLFII